MHVEVTVANAEHNTPICHGFNESNGTFFVAPPLAGIDQLKLELHVGRGGEGVARCGLDAASVDQECTISASHKDTIAGRGGSNGFCFGLEIFANDGVGEDPVHGLLSVAAETWLGGCVAK